MGPLDGVEPHMRGYQLVKDDDSGNLVPPPGRIGSMDDKNNDSLIQVTHFHHEKDTVRPKSAVDIS